MCSSRWPSPPGCSSVGGRPVERCRPGTVESMRWRTVSSGLQRNIVAELAEIQIPVVWGLVIAVPPFPGRSSSRRPPASTPAARRLRLSIRAPRSRGATHSSGSNACPLLDGLFRRLRLLGFRRPLRRLVAHVAPPARKHRTADRVAVAGTACVSGLRKLRGHGGERMTRRPPL